MAVDCVKHDPTCECLAVGNVCLQWGCVYVAGTFARWLAARAQEPHRWLCTRFTSHFAKTYATMPGFAWAAEYQGYAPTQVFQEPGEYPPQQGAQYPYNGAAPATAPAAAGYGYEAGKGRTCSLLWWLVGTSHFACVGYTGCAAHAHATPGAAKASQALSSGTKP